MPSSFSTETNMNLELVNTHSALENPDSADNHGFKEILFHVQHPQNSMNFFGSVTKPSGNKKSCGERKRKRKVKDDVQKREEVVHVRAKRGQATDSHSLAERVRREKIHEKLRCLQDLVPGCYKAMGMAVMLDIIISYIQSLQNQIEFLSMKLSSASMYYDLSFSELEAMETIQGIKINGNEQLVQEMERMARKGYRGPSNYDSTWPL